MSKARFIVFQRDDGKWTWNLRGGNNRIIATAGEGDGFSALSKAVRAANNVADSLSMVSRQFNPVPVQVNTPKTPVAVKPKARSVPPIAKPSAKPTSKTAATAAASNSRANAKDQP